MSKQLSNTGWKLLALVLSVLIAIVMMPAAAFAEGNEGGTKYYYGTADLTWSQLYGNENFDVITSATTGFAGSIAHADATVNAKTTNFTGVKDVPVAVDAAYYDGLSDEQKKALGVTISEDQTAPAWYVILDKDGYKSIIDSDVNVTTIDDATAVVEAPSAWGSYCIQIKENADSLNYLGYGRGSAPGKAAETTISFDNLIGAVITDSEGNNYTLGYMENLWVATYELSLRVTETTSMVHMGNSTNYKQFENIPGKTISSITYYTTDGAFKYEFADGVFLKNQPGTEITGDEGVTLDAANGEKVNIDISKLPSDSKYELTSLGRSGRRVATDIDTSKYSYADGVLSISGDVTAGAYEAVFSDSTGKYVDIEYDFNIGKAMASTTIGGLTYYYVDTTDDDDYTVYTFAVTTGRGASATTTNYYYTKSDLTHVGDTDYYYIVKPGSTALSGTLYGYTGGTATTYAKVYKDKAKLKLDSSYDAISSATAFTSRHAGDISSVVTYGTDSKGNKTITGLNLGRTTTTVEADTYVAASILNAAGKDLSDDQKAALGITLKQNPTLPPSTSTVNVSGSATFPPSSKYGSAEFDIALDDATLANTTWNEYWDSVYAATISNGKNTAAAVHWIDLYGEFATSGAHYNKLQIALNNGTSIASNAANVGRYAAFYDANGFLKAGTYTITVYAEGYSNLTATVTVTATDAVTAAANYATKLADAADASDSNAVIAAYKALTAAKTSVNALKDDSAAALKTQLDNADTALATKAPEAYKNAQEITAFESSKPVIKLKKGKKKFTVKSSNITNATGYVIKYSKKKNMKSAKTVNVKNAAGKTALNKTVKKLKKKKNYYVQVTAYKTIGNQTYYTQVSKTTKVKTK